MDYIAYHFSVKADELFKKTACEILIAELGEAGFESFVETDEGVTAYIQEGDCHPGILDDLMILDNEAVEIEYTKEKIEQVNWNAEWEKHFDPITVDDRVYIRAPFHEAKQYPFEIVIEPKMSFGTGHHETTHLMIRQMLSLDFKGKTVLDMGTGTGVLAILAEMLRASNVDAIDIDKWSYENALENVVRNNCKKIVVKEGDVSLLSDKKYEIILANINRNILLQDMPGYAARLKSNGIMVLSGFYEEDVKQITDKAGSLGLKLAGKMERNKWISLKFVNLK